MARFAATSHAGNRAGRWLVVVAVAAGLEPATLLSEPAEAEVGARRRPAIRRAAAPATWDPAVESAFEPDAFRLLEGPRPDPATAPAAVAPAGSTGGSDPSATGFRWSSLISATTLVDEIKDAKAGLTIACDKAGDFKAGGFDKARRCFGAAALCFGVIAAYDQDIRWRRDAAAARDRFARAGLNCTVGTDQSFTEARARLDDLQSLLDGNPLPGRAETAGDFRWSMVAARPAVMSRLEEAEQAIRPAISSPADFARQVEPFVHAVEMVAAIGEVIVKPDFEDHDDDAYVGHAVEMRDAAVAARAAAAERDYEAARAAVGRIGKSCVACHGEYRG